MSLTTLGWLFTLGVLVHNTEEAVYLPAWSVNAGRWYRPIAASTFRIAITVVSGLLLLLTAIASRAAPGSVGAYLMSGYVLTMLLNAFVPHALVTVLQRRYMPGTLTALLLNLPLGMLYLHQALVQHSIELHTFLWSGPLIAVAAMLLLFTLGRIL